MASKRSGPAAVSTRMPVFPVACWSLGVIAFVQLLIAGLALATRLEESREVRIVEKEVTKLVTVRLPAPGSMDEGSVVSRPPAPPVFEMEPEVTAPPEPTPVDVPAVADPRAERLINEAREARVAGDMGRAIVKLEEARNRSPEEAAVHYELGLVHEQMGVFDLAAEHYEKVFQMGISGAGALYEAAAAKLRDGFEQPGDMLGKLALGRVIVFKDPEDPEGERVVLTIPVQKAPGAELDVSEIEVVTTFFNRSSKGEIVVREESMPVSEEWVTLPFDWKGGDESLRINYLIPHQGGQMAHLFGDLSYYGQVVSLFYKGEVLDVQAEPRDLAARIPRQPEFFPGPGGLDLPEFFDYDVLPPNFDPGLPLLPPR
jgi:hypothetical protein